jgi:hypothetical protein
MIRACPHRMNTVPTLKFQAASLAALALMFVFPPLAGCQSRSSAQQQEAATAGEIFKKISESLPAPDPNDTPALNPNAKPPVHLSGEVSDGMHIKLYAIYSAFTKSYECRQLSPSGKQSRRPGQYQLDLKVTEANGRFESSFSPDLFLPGDCDWRFVSLGAKVSPNGMADYDHKTESVVEAILPREKPDSSGCVPSPEGECPLNNNWLSTPVLVPCGMYTPTNEGSQGRPKLTPFFHCRARTKGPYKVTHRLKGDETMIEINFIDLRSQLDPT